VRRALSGYVCAWQNQVPGLYAQAPPETSFPREMTASCVEGAGGGNITHLLCAPDGAVRDAFRGYWKPDRFLRELVPHDHAAATTKEDAYLARCHDEAPRGQAVADVLRRIAEEVYTKGRTG